jgi:hypothetical protein
LATNNQQQTTVTDRYSQKAKPTPKQQPTGGRNLRKKKIRRPGWNKNPSLLLLVFLPSSSLSGVCSLILFPLFATGVNNTSGTGGKFAACVIDTGGAP